MVLPNPHANPDQHRKVIISTLTTFLPMPAMLGRHSFHSWLKIWDRLTYRMTYRLNTLLRHLSRLTGLVHCTQAYLWQHDVHQVTRVGEVYMKNWRRSVDSGRRVELLHVHLQQPRKCVHLQNQHYVQPKLENGLCLIHRHTDRQTNR